MQVHYKLYIPNVEDLLMENYTQFGIDVEVKDRLDSFKAKHKNDILKKYNRKKRLVTNTHVIQYLLDKAEAKK